MSGDDTLTEERLVELERLCEEATPGPWGWWKYGLQSEAEKSEAGLPRGPYVLRDHPDGVQEGAERQEDLDFIAASRTALPALVAEVRRLRRALADACRQIREGEEELLARVDGDPRYQGVAEDIRAEWASRKKLGQPGDPE